MQLNIRDLTKLLNVAESTVARASERSLYATRHHNVLLKTLHPFRKDIGRVVIGRHQKVQLRIACGAEDLCRRSMAVVGETGMGVNDASEFPVPLEEG